MKIDTLSRMKANAVFPGLKKAETPSRIQAELAAIASARDENMQRLRQLRLERDAQTRPAAKQTPQAVKGAKARRSPGTSGRG